MNFALVTTRGGSNSRDKWNNTIFNELDNDFSALKPFILAVTQHHYLNDNYGLQTPINSIEMAKEAIAEGISYPIDKQTDYDLVPDDYKIWYTEYGEVKNIAEDTWAAGVRYAALVLSRINMGDKVGQLDYHYITDNNLVKVDVPMKLASVGIAAMQLSKAAAEMQEMQQISFANNPYSATANGMSVDALHGYKFKNTTKETLFIINISENDITVPFGNLFTYSNQAVLTQYSSTSPQTVGVYNGHSDINSIINQNVSDDFIAKGFSISVITVDNPTSTPVASITVQGQGGVSTITTNAGTLQMEASILPSEASQSVIWSVINGTGQATINTNGILTAVADGDVTVRATANDGSDVFGETVITLSNQVLLVDMTFQSISVTQASISDVNAGSIDNEVIRIEVITTGSENPLNLEKFRLNINGSTALADILSTKAYYTGNTNSFNSNTLYGTMPSPASVTAYKNIAGAQLLSEGSNYFWITMDIDANATIANTIDSRIYKVFIDGTDVLNATEQDPVGNRIITGSIPAPVSEFSGTPLTICEGESVIFADESTNVPSTWVWNFGDEETSTDQNPTHTYAVAGTYTVSLTASNSGGSGPEVKIDYINVIAAPNAGTNGSLTVCEGTIPTESELFSALEGSPDAGGTWSNVDLEYTYSLTAISPCVTDAAAIVTVTEQSAPNAGTNGDLTICEGTIPTESELFSALEGSPDAGGTWSNVDLEYTYSLTAISPCVTDAISTVTVTETPLPTAAFTFDDSNEPLIIFTNSSGEADSYSWNLGDGTIETTTDVTHNYSENGTYTVVLSATNSCGTATNSQDVTITNIGILKISAENIQVYPNPVESILNIKLPISNVSIQLVNTDGKMLKSLKTTQNRNVEINVEDLARGIYYLLITSENNERTVVKIVKS